MTGNPRDIRTDISIETSGQEAVLEIGEKKDVDIHIRGDATEAYDIQVRDTDEGSWLTVDSVSASADYDKAYTRGEAWVRVTNTGGGNTATDTADVYISAS